MRNQKSLMFAAAMAGLTAASAIPGSAREAKKRAVRYDVPVIRDVGNWSKSQNGGRARFKMNARRQGNRKTLGR